METTPVSITLIAMSPKAFYTSTIFVGVAMTVAYTIGKNVGARKAAQKSK